MESATYFEQLYDLGQYILSQWDFPDISRYSTYIVLGIAFLIILIIVRRIISHRKAVYEYIEDGICLKLMLPPMGDKKEGMRNLLKVLHEKYYELFKNKRYFAIELLIKQGQQTLFLFLPKVVYEHIADQVSRYCEVKEVTKMRETFVDSLGANITSLEFELNRDFVYPLILNKIDNQHFSSELEGDGWLFLQMLARPVGNSWLKILDRYINDLGKGRDPSGVGFGGCSGGCLGVTFPFFNFLGDFLTSFIHGSSSKASSIVDKKATLDDTFRMKRDLVEKKRDSQGFEFLFRVCVKGYDREKMYLLSERFLDIVTSEEGMGNSFVVSRVKDKLKGDIKNDLLLANMSKSCVDVLTIDEIISLIDQFV